MSTQNSDKIREAFRRWGYLQANLDNFGRLTPLTHAEVDGFSASETKQWRQIYCGSIGVEFMHIYLSDRVAWIAEQMERAPSAVDQKFILQRIQSAELFERFLHGRYVGVTRFSIEGIAALIPLLDSIVAHAADQGFEYIVFGMSHRARLAVMTYIAGAPLANIIACFEDVDPKSALGRGDVKYHKGATGTYQTANGKSVRIHLASNPSHLEAIDPVILGRVRAKQLRLKDETKGKVLAVLLHGDAAFAGQGICAETLNFSNIKGFDVGGVVHVIVNNLIGFTESPEEFQSTRYASDLAKRLPIPIFHVNGEDPDAVVRVGEMAVNYRATFASDVVIDLIGFRRHGHNEGDDPTLTQPLLYTKISKHPPLYVSYANRIGVSSDVLSATEEKILAHLASERDRGVSMTQQPSFSILPDYWKPFVGGWYDKTLEVSTNCSAERLLEITKRLTELPKDFNPHPKLKKGYELRREMGEGKKPIDWGMAETLAIGSLLWEGVPVRLTGQDTRRGTFSHRHAVLIDVKTGGEYTPLAHLHPKQAWFEIFDSILSEAAAVGFEYGFSRDFPEALVCWEAQFGDFVNGAQTIIDQFLSAGEDKWGLLSGLVLLLPHGFEGRGPEHSSARIERFLSLAGEDNIQVCYPSTAAQYFHLLRRQALRKWRKPLIVFTPKSLLRAASAQSPLSEFTNGSFETVIYEPERPEATRVLVCSGKISHELHAERAAQNDTNTAIIRLEQLYPLPEEELHRALKLYSSAKIITWVQEEPANMGALSYIRPHLERLAGNRNVSTVRRSQSASPATGSAKAHALEQEAVIKRAFATFS